MIAEGYDRAVRQCDPTLRQGDQNWLVAHRAVANVLQLAQHVDHSGYSDCGVNAVHVIQELQNPIHNFGAA